MKLLPSKWRAWLDAKFSKSAPTIFEYRNCKAEVALVLLHGFSGNAVLTWNAFTEKLLATKELAAWDIFGIGYPSGLRIDIPNVWSADPDLETLAIELRTILSLHPFTRYRRIAIGAHSMGGLVAQRAILTDQVMQEKLSHLFLFGTPSGGLEKARIFAALKRQIRDMSAGQPFINTLRQQWNEKFATGTPFVFHVVAGDMDQFVPPSSSLAVFPMSCQAVVPGNHVEIVRPATTEHPSFQLLSSALSGAGIVPSFLGGARLAIERGEFRKAIELLLPKAAELDKNALAGLALALEGIGRTEDALAVLEQHCDSSSTDAIGILAGRLKRRWLVSRTEKDLIRALELYRSALDASLVAGDHQQIFYHAINIAFLSLMATPPASDIPVVVKEMAELAINHCADYADSHWAAATEGEANLLLGQIEIACEHYKRAIAMVQSPREVDSMYSQAIRVATRMFGKAGADRIESLFDYK